MMQPPGQRHEDDGTVQHQVNRVRGKPLTAIVTLQRAWTNLRQRPGDPRNRNRERRHSKRLVQGVEPELVRRLTSCVCRQVVHVDSKWNQSQDENGRRPVQQLRNQAVSGSHSSQSGQARYSGSSKMPRPRV